MFKHSTNFALALLAGFVSLIFSAAVGNPYFAGPAAMAFVLALVFNYLADVGAHIYYTHFNKEQK